MSTPSTELQLPSEPFRLEQVLKLAPSAPQIGLVVALAAALTLAVGVVMWAARPSMVPLDVRLQGAQRIQAINELENRHQAYEITDGMVLVPQEVRSRLRMELGLDGALVSGGELTATDAGGQSAMTDSEADKRRRNVKALERSLARTIAEIQGVSAAGVHLVVPRARVFVGRRHTLASASVKLTMAPGRVLDPGQVSGIVNLVTNAVPNLQSSKVTVTDQRGRQLNSDDTVSGERSRDLAYKQEYEQMLLAKVESLLDPLLGTNGYRASIDASLDFTRAESKRTILDPSGMVMRSGKTDVQGSRDAMAAMGVPGALENQPPEGGSLEKIGDDGPAEEPSGNFRRSETTNNEIPEETRHEVEASWRLERLNLSVVVDDRVQVNEAGEITRTPRDAAEIEKYTELLKTTVGFDEERGDRVSIVNISMQGPTELEPLPAIAMWEQPWFEQVVKSSLAGLALLLLVLMVIRPTTRALIGRDKVKALTADSEGAEGEGEGAEGVEGDTPLLESDRISLSGDAQDMLEPPARVHGDILNLAKEMAAQDPKRVATVLKKWMEVDE